MLKIIQCDCKEKLKFLSPIDWENDKSVKMIIPPEKKLINYEFLKSFQLRFTLMLCTLAES